MSVAVGEEGGKASKSRPLAYRGAMDQLGFSSNDLMRVRFGVVMLSIGVVG